jgi:hypothetical protein
MANDIAHFSFAIDAAVPWPPFSAYSNIFEGSTSRVFDNGM